MQDTEPDPIKHGCFFEHKDSQNFNSDWNTAKSLEANNSPYMLETLDIIDRMMAIYSQRLGVRSFRKFHWQNEYVNKRDVTFHEYRFLQDKGNLIVTKLSGCKYFLALVYGSNVVIQKPGNFLTSFISPKHSEAEFSLTGGEYIYLEWPVVNEIYIEHGPYFLTLDDSGRLRIHYIKEKTEQIIEEEGGEKYRSACFSVDGREIYAINEKQEVCRISLKDMRTVSKRVLPGFSGSEEVQSTYITQIAPLIFAIGFVHDLSGLGEPQPYLQIIQGDLSDLECQLRIKTLHVPSVKPLDSCKPVVFRTFYLKERQLLLVGHTRGTCVLALSIGIDGALRELDGIDLGRGTLRGIALMREEKPLKGVKKSSKIQYQRRRLQLPLPPQILFLDSQGSLHRYYYYDTRFAASAFSMFFRLLSINEFNKRETLGLVRRLHYQRKSRRCKSLSKHDGGEEKSKNGNHRHCRSKSDLLNIRKECLYSDLIEMKKISPEEKQKVINQLKGQSEEPTQSQAPTISEATPVSLFKIAENPFAQNKTTQEKPVTTSLFSSSIKTSATTTTAVNSLFGDTSKKPTFSLFQPKTTWTPKETKVQDEARNSLFSVTKKCDLFAQNPGLDPANLLSANAPQKSFLKVFTTTSEDPLKKKALLFLNKLESDVVFKVETEEFPAHKSILSERCKFFKNMFASGMLESHSAVIEIKDTKASIFKAFLEYVYLNQTVLNEDLALNLLDLAEKYIIDDLKKACENYLPFYLKLDNCIRIFEAACLYDCLDLKKKAVFFFQMNFQKIMERSDFNDLPKMTYLNILRIYWRHNVVLGPELSKLIVY